MRVKSIELYNMFRFSKSQLELPENVSLVLGRNEDSAGADSNGAGKSSMFYALSWCLFKQLPIRLRLEDIKREGTSAASVTVELTEGDSTIKVVRTMDGAGTDLQVFVDNEEVKRQTNTQLQTYLLRVLGFEDSSTVAYQDFLNTSYLTSETIDMFASAAMGARERLDFIARALGLTVLDRASDAAKEKQSFFTQALEVENAQAVIVTEDELTTLATLTQNEITFRKLSVNAEKEVARVKILIKKQEEVQTYEEGLRKIENKLLMVEEDRRNKMEPLRRRFDLLASQMEESPKIEASLEKFSKALITLEEANPKQVTEKRKEELQLRQREVARVQIVLKDRRDVSAKMASTERNLEKCPKCKTPLIRIRGVLLAFEEENFEETKAAVLREVQETEKALLEAKQEETVSQGFVNAFDVAHTKMVELRSQIKNMEITLEKLEGLDAELEKINVEGVKENEGFNKTAEALEIEKERHEKGIAKIYAKDPDLRSKNIGNALIEATDSLMRLRTQLQRDQFDRSQIEEKIIAAAEHGMRKERLLIEEREYGGWKSGFLRIRAALIGQWVPLLAETANGILEGLYCGLRVVFTVSPEKYHPKFDIDVYDEEGYSRPYGTYSQGERKRISIAINLALRQLAFDRGSLVLNFILLDEVVDALDGTGTSSFFRVLQKQNCQAMCISHNEEFLAKFRDVIRIVRKGGISDFE